MPLNHKFDSTKWNERKNKRDQVKNNPGNENSVPQLRDRVETLEQAIGLREAPPGP